MRKFWTALLAGLLVIPMLFQSQAQAAVNFTILIDGVRLTTSQAPVMIQGRVMLPMRAIFEALDAKVTWNQKAQTVTAVKDRTTILLKINAKTATINRQNVRLDVPAKNLKGTTMVPVRFVSESLGEKVGWNSKTKTVSITTGGGSVPDTGLSPVSYVTLKDVGNNGDGRDLEVSFSKSATEARAAQYRVMIVKASKSSSFNLSTARMVSSSNYAVLFPSGSDASVTLNSGSRDVDGEYIRENQAYTAYVLIAGRNSGEFALSSASPVITLTNTNAVETATNVKGNDINDYKDGRDLSVSFTRAKNESNISNYRVIAVKTKDISRFDLAAAKSVPSQNYTTVNKTSSSSTTLTSVMNSSSRDSSGEYIKNGVPYTLYVLSVSSNENTAASKLSSASASITLATGSTTAPVITQVADVNDYGDGRDLRVSFTKLSDESGIGSYRIFVVKSNDYQNFSLSRANSVSSYNYTQVNKTGSNINQTLTSGSRDVDGATIRSGVYYRVFVMSVGTGNNSGNNNLSSVSGDIILHNNTNVGTISNLNVSDINDYNDGRDLQVSFNRASDEYNISHYRAFVVKSNKASSFDLYDANSLSSYYYTQIDKSGYNISKPLSSSSRDTDGDYIRNGISYRVFIMSAGNGNSSGSNALSSYSSIITLGSNRNVTAVSNVAVKDVSDYNDSRDLEVSFTRASDEYNIGSYRILVVKSENAGSFDLWKANQIPSAYYTSVSKTNGNIRQVLPSGARDVDGAAIKNGTSYRVFVLSVGSGSYSGNNALSYASGNITLTGNSPVTPVTNVQASDRGDNNDGSDLIVSFNKAANEALISRYQVYVVKEAEANGFTAAKANNLSGANYTTMNITGDNIRDSLSSEAKDINGEKIRNLVPYKVFVLSVSKDGNVSNNTLSAPSPVITLKGTPVPVSPPLSVTAKVYDTNGEAYIEITFSPSIEAVNAGNISEYRLMVVPTNQKFGDTEANKVTTGNYTKVDPEGKDISRTVDLGASDVNGNAIVRDTPYRVYVLAVARDKDATENALSGSSGEIRFTVPSPAASEVTALPGEDSSSFQVSFKPAADERNISSYQIMILPVNTADSFDLKKAATSRTVNAMTTVPVKPTLTGKNYSVKVDLPAKDTFGKEIQPGKEYKIMILTVTNKTKALTAITAVSKPSKPIILIAAKDTEKDSD